MLFRVMFLTGSAGLTSFLEPVLGRSEFGPDDHSPADYAQAEREKASKDGDERDEADKDQANHNSQERGNFGLAKSVDQAFSEEVEKDDPAEDFNDESNDDEGEKNRDAYQNQGKQSGENDQAHVDDDAQNTRTRDRPEGFPDLIRGKCDLPGEKSRDQQGEEEGDENGDELDGDKERNEGSLPAF